MFKVGDVVNISTEVIAVGKVKDKNGKDLEVVYILKPHKANFDFIIDDSEEDEED